MLRLINSYLAAYRGLPKPAWMLFFVVLVNRCGMMVVFFLALYLTRKLGFTTTQAGQLIGIFGVGSLIGSYYGGWLTDKIGSFRVQLYSLLSTAAAMVLLSFLQDYWAVAAGLVLVGILNDALRPASITAFTEICPPELHARAFAFNRLGVNLGTAIGPAVGGLLVTINYSLIFWVDGATCFASGILFYFLFRRQPTGHKHDKQVQREKSASPWKDGYFITLLGLFLALGILFFQLFNTWPLYLKESIGLSEPQIGLLLTLNAVIIVLIEMPLVHRLERINPLKIMILGSAFIWGGFAMLNAGTTFAFVILTVVVWTLGEIMTFPMTTAAVARRTNAGNRGVYMGMYTLTFSLSFVVGPVLGSLVMDTWGANVLWTLVGIVGTMVTIGFWRLYFVQKKIEIRESLV